MTKNTPAQVCFHEQRRGGGRQDLFCKKAPGHAGNHFHDAHPGGARWFKGRGWAYGEQIAYCEANPLV